MITNIGGKMCLPAGMLAIPFWKWSGSNEMFRPRVSWASCDHTDVFLVSEGSASLCSLPSTEAKLRASEVWHDSLLLLFFLGNYFADFFPTLNPHRSQCRHFVAGVCQIAFWDVCGDTDFKLIKVCAFLTASEGEITFKWPARGCTVRHWKLGFESSLQVHMLSPQL